MIKIHQTKEFTSAYSDGVELLEQRVKEIISDGGKIISHTFVMTWHHDASGFYSIIAEYPD